MASMRLCCARRAAEGSEIPGIFPRFIAAARLHGQHSEQNAMDVHTSIA